MDLPLSVRLLGGFSLQEGDASPRAPGSSRVQALVAWLACAPQPSTTRQTLAAVLWPDAADRQARNNLRQLLHQLRQAWPDHTRWITADAHAVTWRAASVRVDVLEFERAFAVAQASWQRGEREQAGLALGLAAGLYGGPFLPACADAWIAARRERLQQAAAQALETLSRILEERHDLTAAIERATALVSLDPVRERSYLRLMRLHALNRDRAAAIRVYEQCAQVLRQELDMDPGPELRDVFARLTRPAAAASHAGASRGEVVAPPLVGRALEWRTIRDASERAERGPGHLVLVTGEAGLGKTRLGEEALTWAEARGGAAARARAYEAEGRLALAPVTAWLRSPAIRPTLAGLDEVWLSEIARLLTELLVERPDLPPPVPLADYGQRQRFFEALARAIGGAAPSLVLLLDDLQWCDPDTIEWLHYLLRAETAARLLVIGTARLEEVGVDHPLTRLRTALQATSQVTEISLRPLDAAETARLASAVAGREFQSDEVLRLFRDTEGNPLFVVETLRAVATFVTPAADAPGASRLPPRVSAVITGRLRQLSADGRELAGVAATIGRAFTSDLLLHASGLDEERVSRALDELWQRRIIREATSLRSADAYDFTHDKLREVAYLSLSPVQRRRWHRRVAVALGGMFASDLDAVAAQVAAHYDQAGQTADALPIYDRAAQVAMRLFAYDEAQTLLRRMLALLEQEPESRARAETELRVQLMLAAAIRVSAGWASPGLEPLHQRIVALTEQVGGLERQATARVSLVFFLLVRAEMHLVGGLLDDMQAVVDASGARVPHVMGTAALIGHHAHQGRFVEAEHIYEREFSAYSTDLHAPLVALMGADFGVLQRAWSSHALWALGRTAEAAQRCAEAVALAETLAHPFSQALALSYLAMLHTFAHDISGVRAAAQRALDIAERHRVIYYRAWASLLLAWADASEDPGEQTIASLQACIRAFCDTGARARLPFYHSLMASVYLTDGKPQAALDELDDALRLSATLGEVWWDAELHRTRGEALALLARHDEALAACERALATARAQHSPVFEARAAETLEAIRANAAPNTRLTPAPLRYRHEPEERSAS